MTTRQDGAGVGDNDAAAVPAYCNVPHSREMANFLAHQQQLQQQQLHHSQQQAQGPMIWPPQQQPQHHLNASFQAHHHPQTPSAPQQPQPAVYNEYMYNVASYSTPAGQPETYSVLPVGHGNFLKVYHCPENLGSESNAALYAQQPPAASFTHVNMGIQAPPPPSQPQQQQYQLPIPLYELFAEPCLPNFEKHPSELVPPPSQSPTFSQFDDSNSNNVANSPSSNMSNNSNLFINNLVNNWSPNLTGASYTQFGVEAAENGNNFVNSSPVHTQPQQQQLQTSNPQQQQQQKQQPTPQQYNAKAPVNTNATVTLPSPATPAKIIDLDATNNVDTAKPAVTAMQKTPLVMPGINEGKKRIVAEVKPMPMSYSDVLSKGTLRTMTQANSAVEGRTPNGLDTANVTQTRRQGKEDANNGNQQSTRSSKRSPLHEVKEGSAGLQQMSNTLTTNNNGNRNKKRSQVNQTTQQKSQMQQQTQQTGQSKANKTQPQPTQEKKRSNNPQLKPNNSSSNSYSVRVNENKLTTGNNNNIQSTTTATASQQTSRKGNNNSSGNNNNNNKGNQSSYSSNGNYSNANSNNSNSNGNLNAGNSNNSSSSSSKRYYNSSNANLNSNSGYSYSSKRNRGNAYSSSSSPAHASNSRNRNYELAKRILHTWWIYTLKLLTWLFYLVYDIVVLGCSMAYERLTTGYVAGLAYAKQIHKELKQNSGKPSIWWRNYWRRFDARFKKNSRWAFWRRFYKRKPPEPTTENFKTGRLPQTGEEAMYSLLNCKGKDAYSILGVPPDSPQEQIRKHYKKIAVLVHPDKNKQAGAEEAFKVLQRAFELIGEPENRLAYDQSIAETLHQEKAWTELHDLLSQLQTKMTEAANTIRCSTCAQRHPRKLTERPQYAARQCASCKIRHSAKDGDIWAETSILGLRWKYLALMDGKVYDITEWANCQKGALSHLEPNSHMVQYRIVRGAQQQQQQQQQNQPPHHQQQHQHHSQHHERGPHHHGGVSGMSGVSEATLHEFLDNLYSGQHPGNTANSAPFAGSTRRRTRRN